MSKRFDDLKKVPKQPALRLLAMAGTKLSVKLDLPASASVTDVMQVLAKQGNFVDMLRLMGAALPPRERAWWACLAARDLIPEGEEIPPSLALSEAWVRKPNDDLRVKLQQAAESADMDDDTVMCGMCVIYYDDTLGPGERSKMQGPTGVTQSASFGMNIKALGQGDSIPQTADVLIDRAVDIARGGNGKIPLPGKRIEEEA